MKTMLRIALASAMIIGATAAQAADTTQYNSTPADGWFYGGGNDYTPANTEVLTTDTNQQLYLRWHEYQEPAPASDSAGLYTFDLGAVLSFDWGVDDGLTAASFPSVLITLTNLGTGQTAIYPPFFPGNDNAYQDGSAQNSARLTFGFLSGLGFDPNVNDTYQVNLSYTDAAGSLHSLDAFAQIGTGAVPEPATWAMMMLGLGMIGAAMRRRRRTMAVSLA